MVNVYDFSFEEFEKYYSSLRDKARKTNRENALNEKEDKKEFSSIEELADYYNLTDAVEFFKNEILKWF